MTPTVTRVLAALLLGVIGTLQFLVNDQTLSPNARAGISMALAFFLAINHSALFPPSDGGGGKPSGGAVGATMALAIAFVVMSVSAGVGLFLAPGCALLNSPGAQVVEDGVICVLQHSTEPPEQIAGECGGMAIEDVIRVLEEHKAAAAREQLAMKRREDDAGLWGRICGDAAASLGAPKAYGH